MSQKGSYKPNPPKNAAPVSVHASQDPYPLDKLSGFCARLLLWATVIALPLLMDATKYSQITNFKKVTFILFFVVAAILLILSTMLSETTRVTRRKSFAEAFGTAPPFWADVALLAYWVLMFISCICAEDPYTAFIGINPRNNGFLYQTMYVGTYFLISYALRPALPTRRLYRRRSFEGGEVRFIASRDAIIFTLGGTLLAITCIMHFFGVDLYNIASVNGADYGGPFWPGTKYRFLGPVGNVNLGSYILAAAAVITAGLYVNKIGRKYDRHGIITLLCFAIILYAELNINTDAGVVALAVAAVLLPAILCSSVGHFNRLMHVYGVALGTLLLNQCLVQTVLRGEDFGSMGMLLTAVVAMLTVASGAGLSRHLSCRHSRIRTLGSGISVKKFSRKSGKKRTLSTLRAKRGTSSRVWRTVRSRRKVISAAICAFSTAVLSVGGALAVALWMTSAKGNPNGESTLLHRFGYMLRDGGRSALTGFAVLAVAVIAITAVIMLYSNVRMRISGKVMRGLGIAFAVVAIAGGLTLAYVITEPDPTPAGSLAGAVKVTDKADLKEKSDTIVHELGQMLRGNFDDSFGHNRLFTWKRTLRLVKVRPVFGIGPDNFKSFFASYFHDEAVKMFPSSNGNLDKAHNEFLDVLLCNGIAGLLAYLSFFGILLWHCFRRDTRGRIAPVMGIAVAAYMAHAFFGYQLPIQSPVMWAMIGLTAAYLRAENAPAD